MIPTFIMMSMKVESAARKDRRNFPFGLNRVAMVLPPWMTA